MDEDVREKDSSLLLGLPARGSAGLMLALDTLQPLEPQRLARAKISQESACKPALGRLYSGRAKYQISPPSSKRHAKHGQRAEVA